MCNGMLSRYTYFKEANQAGLSHEDGWSGGWSGSLVVEEVVVHGLDLVYGLDADSHVAFDHEIGQCYAVDEHHADVA